MLSTERGGSRRRPDPPRTASTIDAGRDETRDVVDVAVRVVADASLAEPDRLADAEVLGEDALVAVARSRPGLRTCTSASSHSSVDEQRPCAVGLDAAALEDEPLRRRRAASARRAAGRVMRAIAAADRRVARKLSYFAQPLNAQFTSATRPASSMHDGRRRVAQPDAIGRDDVQTTRSARTPCASSCFARAVSHVSSWQRISTALVLARARATISA